MKIKRAPTPPIPTFKYLDDIITILGSTKTTFWPILESQDDGRDDLEIYSYKEKVHTLKAGSDATEPFYPYRHVGGVYSLSFNAGDSQWLLGTDSSDHSFGDGTTDEPFSVGMWILPPGPIGTTRIMNKGDAGTGEREWQWYFNNGKLNFEIMDESGGPATERGEGINNITLNEWQFVTVTYDGDETDAAITLYNNAVLDSTPGTVTTGTYVAMENASKPIVVGSWMSSNAPSSEFTGRIALPFICGKELTLSEISSLYTIGQKLLGLA